MIAWDPELYLRYEKERTQPSLDLTGRIPLEAPREVIDLGCGPGNSTRILLQRWPNARIVGLDSSPAMIERARQRAEVLEKYQALFPARKNNRVLFPFRRLFVVATR
jgi:trans-aconitate methyltransferase